jgi:hypothetical protein
VDSEAHCPLRGDAVRRGLPSPSTSRFGSSARSSGAPRSCFTARSPKAHSLRLPAPCGATDGFSGEARVIDASRGFFGPAVWHRYTAPKKPSNGFLPG